MKQFYNASTREPLEVHHQERLSFRRWSRVIVWMKIGLLKIWLMVVGVTVVVASSTPIPSGGEDSPDVWGNSEPEFTFVRLMYSGGNRRGSSWATDYPKADRQFLYALRKLTDFSFINATGKAIPIMSDELFQYPFVYAVEVGYMRLSQEEAAQLREYLLRGGFLVVDDFHGDREWNNFYSQLKKVFPEYEPEVLPLSHPIYHCYYDIHELFQVPGLQYLYTGRTWEKGGYEAKYMGVRDRNGRLMVVINYNVDFGDAWEWFEVEEYPRKYAHLAFQLGVNYIIYAMTH